MENTAIRQYPASIDLLPGISQATIYCCHPIRHKRNRPSFLHFFGGKLCVGTERSVGWELRQVVCVFSLFGGSIGGRDRKGGGGRRRSGGSRCRFDGSSFLSPLLFLARFFINVFLKTLFKCKLVSQSKSFFIKN